MTNDAAKTRCEPNGGSHISEPAPIHGGAAQAAAAGAGCPGARGKVKVLIVEDSPIVRERLAGLIADLQHVSIIGQATDGFAAQALFRQHRPDVVVLDIQLPGVNGMDLLAQFKQEHPASKVMILTTYAFKELRQRCLSLGADHFFDKASEFERITEILKVAVPPAAQSK